MELKEVDHYQLEIRTAHPVGFVDLIRIDDPDERPRAKVVEVGGLKFERYGDDDEWTEVRLDYIVDRRFRTIYKDPPEQTATSDLPSPVGFEVRIADQLGNKGALTTHGS